MSDHVERRVVGLAGDIAELLTAEPGSTATTGGGVMSNRAGNVLACPHCMSPDHLGENAKGWRGVKTARMVDGRVVVDLMERRVYDAERTSWFCSNDGCDVDLHLRDAELVQLDQDGRAITVHPGQTAHDAAHGGQNAHT